MTHMATPDQTLPGDDAFYNERWDSWLCPNTPLFADPSNGFQMTHTIDAIDKVNELAEALHERILQLDDPARGVQRWLLDAGDDPTERINRWAALRTFDLCMPQEQQDPKSKGRDGARPALPRQHAPNARGANRIMADLEAGLIRQQSLRLCPKTIGPLAASEAGAASGELALITSTHMTRAGNSYLLNAPGTVRTTKSGYPEVSPRVLAMPKWATYQIEVLVQTRDADEPLFYGGYSNEPHAQQSSILMNLRNTLDDALLTPAQKVKPLAIRNTAARKLYDTTRDFEAVTRRLGHTNWDFIRCEIGL